MRNGRVVPGSVQHWNGGTVEGAELGRVGRCSGVSVQRLSSLRQGANLGAPSLAFESAPHQFQGIRQRGPVGIHQRQLV
jgi:hypothetical protein